MDIMIIEQSKREDRNLGLESQCKETLKLVIQICKSVDALDNLIKDVTFYL